MNDLPPAVTLAALRAQGPPPTPFRLELPGKGGALVAQRVLRHLPGRRLVLRADLGGEDLLVKLFFRRHDYRRERTGLEWLYRRGVPSPALRWQGRYGAAWLLATEFLSAARSLAGRLEAADATADAGAVLALLGRLHRAGLIQRDAHLDNFLICGGAAYAIDGAGIGRAQGARAQRANLALLLAQFPPAWDRRLGPLLAAYGSGVDGEALARAWRRARQHRLRDYRRKCVRACTEFLVERCWRQVRVRRRDGDDGCVQRLLADPEAALMGAPRLKEGNSATLALVPGTGRDLVIKRYNVKDWRHGLRRAPRPSRAWISWQGANLLTHLGVPTPRALGLREERWGPLRRVAYLITEASEGIPLEGWVNALGDVPVPDWLDQAALELFSALDAAGLSHGDLKASNFLVEESRRKLLLIDLDAMRLHRCRHRQRRALQRDLRRFLANWDGDRHRHFSALLAPLVAGHRSA